MIDAHYTNDVHVKCDSDLGTNSSLLGKMKRVVSFFRDRGSSERHNHSLTNINDKLCNTLRPVVNNGIILRDLKEALIRKQMRDELSEGNNKEDPRYLHKNIKTIRRMNRRKLQILEHNECIQNEHSENTCHVNQKPVNTKNNKDYEFLYLMKSKPISKVDKFIEEIKKENYDYLVSKLNPDYLSRLTISLIKLKKRTNKCYRHVIDVYVSIVEMIFLNVNLKKTLKTTIDQAEQYKADSEILRNTDKLNEYLERIRKVRGKLVPDFDFNIKLKYKKKYRIYIKKYGFPKNKIFDPELMLEIENNLSDSDSDSDSDC